ncbi:MAG: 2,3-bisphosphoglycerate-independent phosphoglycerate mutase [Candidatus Kerfeldbacteria bacterium]|nr:2,3-bisphosphoglycerate-independent phosphoglycerate mutase [Candidatus Kerfeldbacteria bacterium]
MAHVLVILDGWGSGPNYNGNAITQANTPVFDALRRDFSYTELAAAGSAVGLPPKQDGNSEAGHMNIGAGRVVEQEAVTINRTISSGVFFKNPAFVQAIHHVEQHHSKLHLMGLLTNHMSAHAYPDHLEALLLFCRKKNITPYLHLFTDGRDAPPHAAVKLLKELQDHFLDGEIIATIMGRFYAMERNKRWDITAQAYHALVMGEGELIESAEAAITRSYNRNETDEFIKPHIIDRAGLINDNDAVIFFNLRSDRARQLTKAFVQSQFTEHNPQAFTRKKVLQNLCFVSMTDFGPDLDHIVSAFPSPDLSATMPLALQALRQLYIAESEKYAHVTYFLNGGYDHALNGEDWYKVPSPAAANYALHPAMSTAEIVDYVLDMMQQQRYDMYIINFANADMIGHTGNLPAAIQGIETIDQQLGRLWSAVQSSHGTLFVTADHGNAEEMINQATGEIDTEHSIYPVPFIITQPNLRLQSGGCLANVLPTILKVLQLPQPAGMTAEALF